jgi:hypothetical protein
MKRSASFRWLLVFSIAIVWLLAPVVLALVVVRNAEAGFYGARDIVLIPIVSAIVLFVVGLPYFGFFAVAAFRRHSAPRSPWHFRSTARHWVVLALFLVGVLVLSTEVYYWWSVEHAPFVALYSLPIIWLVWVRPLAASPMSKAATVPQNKEASRAQAGA